MTGSECFQELYNKCIRLRQLYVYSIDVRDQMLLL